MRLYQEGMVEVESLNIQESGFWSKIGDNSEGRGLNISILSPVGGLECLTYLLRNLDMAALHFCFV